MADRMAQGIYEVLEEDGAAKGEIGLDMFDYQALQSFKKRNLNIVSPVMSEARVVKTADEIECIKLSTAWGDAAFWKIKNEWLKPGVTENYFRSPVRIQGIAQVAILLPAALQT